MDVNAGYLDLLGLIGIEVAEYSSPVIDARILSDFNATLQRLYAIAPSWWSEREAGDILRGPTPLNGLTLTSGARTITIPGVQDWMIGCTIAIGGDQWQNELSATGMLVRPYTGPDNVNGSAVLYNDAITMAGDTASVLPPVFIRGEGELIPFRSRRDLRAQSDPGYCRDLSYNTSICQPRGYYVDHRLDGVAAHQKLLRVSPLPDAPYVLGWRERTEAPRLASLFSEGGSPLKIPIPEEYGESIFLPVLRMQFSTWKNFETDASTLKALQGQGTDALQTLARLNPQPLKATSIAVSPNW